MAGSFQNFEPHSRKIKPVAIFHPHKCVFRLGAGTEVDRGAATVAQFQMAGYEISMEMGEEYVSDLEAQFVCIGQVLLDIALRIDDDRRRTGLVSEQIRSVGKAAQVVLFENHGEVSLASFRLSSQRQIFVREPYHHRSLAHRGRDAVHRPGAEVARRENSGLAGLERQRFAQLPSKCADTPRPPSGPGP